MWGFRGVFVSRIFKRVAYLFLFSLESKTLMFSRHRNPSKTPTKKGKYSLSLVKFKSNHSILESQVKLTGILSFGLQAWHVLQEHECKIKVECIQHDEKFKLNS